jgi:hypothetical protein
LEGILIKELYLLNFKTNFMSKEKVDLPDNCNPNWVSQKVGKDGDTDTHYGQRGNSNHGHTVRNSDGDIKYARTQGGHVKIDDNRSSSSDSDSSSGGCFVTTATLRAINRTDDNCTELTEFRRFRDEILLTNESDKSLVMLYYKIAPQIVDSINKENNSVAIYNNLWVNYISKGYELLKQKNFGDARALYVVMMNDLVKTYPGVLA